MISVTHICSTATPRPVNISFTGVFSEGFNNIKFNSTVVAVCKSKITTKTIERNQTLQMRKNSMNANIKRSENSTHLPDGILEYENSSVPELQPSFLLFFCV